MSYTFCGLGVLHLQGVGHLKRGYLLSGGGYFKTYLVFLFTKLIKPLIEIVDRQVKLERLFGELIIRLTQLILHKADLFLLFGKPVYLFEEVIEFRAKLVAIKASDRSKRSDALKMIPTSCLV